MQIETATLGAPLLIENFENFENMKIFKNFNGISLHKIFKIFHNLNLCYGHLGPWVINF